MKRLIKNSSLIIFAFITAGSIGIVTLNKLGYLTELVVIQDKKLFMLVSLVCVQLTALYVYVLSAREENKKLLEKNIQLGKENRLLFDQISQDVKSLANDPSAISFRAYNDSGEIEDALATRIRKAKRSVWDLSWKPTISPGFSAKRRQVHHQNMDDAIKTASEDIEYREIFTFSDPRRIYKLKNRIAEGNSGYSCRYFPSMGGIPRLQFVIVDAEYIFFFAISAQGSPLCSIKGKRFCKVFVAYYEAVWDKAVPLKSGSFVHKEAVEKILSKLEQMDNTA